ncbi:hypothetical protein L6R52_12490 [Myxococcota bacterium]|nr:hypothetical protein [Myxococcota bacterium]
MACEFRILDRAAGVAIIEYSFGKQGTANCFIARMADGKLLVVSPAVRMTDATFTSVAELGEVGAVVAPNGFHHLGVAEWRAKFPRARFYAAPESVKRIRSKNASAGEFEPLSQLTPIVGPDIGLGEVPNTKCGETWVWVKTSTGHVWFVSDMLANIPSLPSNPIAALIFKLTKSAPGYRVFSLALTFMVKDKKATLRAVADEMRRHPPSTVVPAHGAPLSDPDIAARTQSLLAEYTR